jgi:ribonuclease D
MSEYTLVENPDSICPQISDQDPVGVDTEFVRERTFFAELSLIQLATRDHIFCVDPLTGAAMDEFWDCLLARTWILHSGRQDIEVVYQAANRMPAALFDTQIAAALLGHAPQLGYASLVDVLFGAALAKSHTRADWSKRPLTEALLHYAAEDVQYLLPAYATLAEQLDKRGRMDWAREDSAQLLNPGLYEVDAEGAIERLKGARNLRGRRRAAAARLAVWREREAIRANRPRQWIARDSVLIAIASSLPENISALQDAEGLAPGLVRRRGQRLLEIIAESAGDEHDYRPPAAPTQSQKALLKQLQVRVAAHARELGIAAEVLASRKDLVAITMGRESESRVLAGWRRDVIGDDLLDLVAGR